MVLKIKSYLYNKQLQNLLQDSITGLKSNIGSILFLLVEDQYNEIPKIIQWTQNQFGNAVKVDFVIRTEADLIDYKGLTNKHVTWYQGIKAAFLNDVRLNHFDLLINMDPTHDRPLLTLTAALKADFKIGFLANSIKIYDLLVESESSDLKFKLEQITQLLDKIKPVDA